MKRPRYTVVRYSAAEEWERFWLEREQIPPASSDPTDEIADEVIDPRRNAHDCGPRSTS